MSRVEYRVEMASWAGVLHRARALGTREHDYVGAYHPTRWGFTERQATTRLARVLARRQRAKREEHARRTQLEVDA